MSDSSHEEAQAIIRAAEGTHAIDCDLDDDCTCTPVTAPTDVLPLLAFSPEASDSWQSAVGALLGFGVTITLADGEQVEATLGTTTWDDEAADVRIGFVRMVGDEYVDWDDVNPHECESAVGVTRIEVA